MVTYFPKYFTSRAIGLYIALLIIIPMVLGHPMSWYWWLAGLIEVAGFFYFSNLLTKQWSSISDTLFERKLFRTSLIIRCVYVVISYLLYLGMTGQPFEFSVGDAFMYNALGREGADMIWSGTLDFNKLFFGLDISDKGYPFYLSIIYALTGKSIIITRLIKALISSLTVVLIYKFAVRNFGQSTGRMAAIFCMLMPNLIYYCGLHLKETEMLFITVVFIERADKILKTKKPRILDIAIMAAAGVASFFFRAVLCYVLVLTLAAALALGSQKLKRGGKIAIGTLLAFGILIIGFGQIGSDFFDAEEYQSVQEQQTNAMNWRSIREGGNSYAKYASASIFAPLIFTIPFPTMVNIETQQNQQMIHGGNYVKNILSFFTILSLILLLLNGKWRDFIVPLAFMCGYLVVLAFSNFAQSERFHIPVLPFELSFAAYGLSQLKAKHKTFFTLWLALMFVCIVGWAWFKLRGRGLM